MFAKKLFMFIPALLMTSPLLFSCSNQDPNTTYLKILNSEDYIADGLIEEFEKEQAEAGKKVKVIYETFDTMENMYNTLKTGKTKYDLVCASDYMVQKLVNSNLLQKINHKENRSNPDEPTVDAYDDNVSPFIRNRLEAIKWGESDKYNLDDYCICYMWGTLGILYNPVYNGQNKDETITAMNTWKSLWNSKYKRTISVKDSMRDTYAIGLIHSFEKELADAGEDIAKRQAIFDYGGEYDEKAKEHIDAIKKDLLRLRDNIFGFEVDSGKEDIVTEKIGIDTAWSGDAVKAINTAEKEKGMELYYSIPDEGSNLWFDCWTVQKGANKDLAYQFLNFLSRPSNAIKNMKQIGYTSAIADNEVKNYFEEKYNPDQTGDIDYNVGYFFKDTAGLSIDAKFLNRQISAQFPTEDEANKLMVMKDYGKNNDLILKMWEEIKHETLPTWAITLFVIEIAVIATAITVVITLKIRNKKRRNIRRAKTTKTN